MANKVAAKEAFSNIKTINAEISAKRAELSALEAKRTGQVKLLCESVDGKKKVKMDGQEVVIVHRPLTKVKLDSEGNAVLDAKGKKVKVPTGEDVWFVRGLGDGDNSVDLDDEG